MEHTLQHDYAKHLKQACVALGYPLWTPEPINTLPALYQQHGLQIGDVGVVNGCGAFHVLFNICKRRDHSIHAEYGVPENFQPVCIQDSDIIASGNAILPGAIYSEGINLNNSGVHHHTESSPVAFKFNTSTAPGSILVLPHGAQSIQHNQPELFRAVAKERALDWFAFARKRYPHDPNSVRSLYLVTGFYKARSCFVASFKGQKAPGKIVVERDQGTHHLRSTISGHFRGGPLSELNNQSVFINAFTITIDSLFWVPVVLRVWEEDTAWSRIVRLLEGSVSSKNSNITVEHSPA